MLVWKKKNPLQEVHVSVSVSMISRGILIFIHFELKDSYKKNSY